jgi:uncharacterized membrane protein YhhN
VTGAAWALLALTAVIAGVDWWAVWAEQQRLEFLAKPATMAALAATALALDPVQPSMRTWFVVAVLFGLVGDVFLMLPRDELFVFGLGSFLVGHLAYVVGLVEGGTSGTGLVVGGVLAFTAVAAVGPTIVRAAADHDPRLALPVAAYILVISVMVTFAFGSTVALAVLGALLFFVSDFAIGWSRFVQPFGSSRMVIITTYHLGQVLLVTSLAIAR